MVTKSWCDDQKAHEARVRELTAALKVCDVCGKHTQYVNGEYWSAAGGNVEPSVMENPHDLPTIACNEVRKLRGRAKELEHAVLALEGAMADLRRRMPPRPADVAARLRGGLKRWAARVGEWGQR